MSHRVENLPDLWREWYTGLSGGYFIVALEQRWGTRWRRDESEKKFFNRRRAIINAIRQYADGNHLSYQTTLDIADQR